MSRYQVKPRSAVLQADTGAFNHYTGSESAVVALNHGDHHAVLIGGGEIHGSAPIGKTVGRVAGTVHVNEGRALGEIIIGKNIVHIDGH